MTDFNKDQADDYPREGRRSSLLDKLKGKHHNIEVNSVSGTETSSMVSTEPKKSRSLFHRKSVSDEEKEAKRKEKRESMADRGAFRVEYRNGVPICVENTDWPPGVSYTESSQKRLLQSQDGTLGGFYSGQGAIAAGGETAANTGPDPDWIPGLSEEEKKKLRNDKSGRYGKLSLFQFSMSLGFGEVLLTVLSVLSLDIVYYQSLPLVLFCISCLLVEVM